MVKPHGRGRGEAVANVAGPLVDQIAAELSAVVFNDPVVLPSERKAMRLTLSSFLHVSGRSRWRTGWKLKFDGRRSPASFHSVCT